MTGLLRTVWVLSPRRVVSQAALLLANGLLGGVGLLLLVPIVNSAAAIDLTGPMSLLPTGVPLGALLATFVLVVTVQALLTRAAAVSAVEVQQQLVDSLRRQALDAVLHARWPYLVGKRRSDILSVVTVGATRAGLAYAQTMQMAVAGVLAVGAALVALWVSPLVGALSIAGVAVIAALQATSIRPSHQLGHRLSERHRSLQGVMQDSLDSLRLVKAHDASDVWAQRLADALTGAREVQVAHARRTSTIASVTSVSMAAAAAALVWIAVEVGVAPTSIVVVLVVVARLAASVRQAVNCATQVANALPAVDDLLGLIGESRAQAESPLASSHDALRLKDSADGPLLSFSDVTFAYPGSDNGVRGLNFACHRGTITALTGPSGAGKSTVVDLALGLLAPDSGEITVCGQPLTASDLPWWRRHVAYVPQETVIIPGTLRDNLAWSASATPTDDECWNALQRAAAAFADDLPEGLDTRLGDGGLRLSGGERQRVALARALMRRPQFLVLDEATSALDDVTEGLVLDQLRKLTPEVTLLVVAHRTSTAASADVCLTLGGARP